MTCRPERDPCYRRGHENKKTTFPNWLSRVYDDHLFFLLRRSRGLYTDPNTLAGSFLYTNVNQPAGPNVAPAFSPDSGPVRG